MGDRNLQVAAPRKNQLQRIALTTTGANTALDARVLGIGWVRVKVVTCNVQLYFTDASGDAVVLDAATGDTCGYPLLAGQWEDFYLTGKEQFVAWDADGTGALYIVRAGVERTGKR